MPIYEYACNACGHEQDILQGLHDEPISICPQCKASTFTKLVSAAGFRLKGGGWYETDFKKSDKKKNLSVNENSPSTNTSESTSNNPKKDVTE